MSFPNFGRLLLVTAIACCVSVLISKKADAGQFSKIVAIVVATDDGQVQTIPVKEVNIKPVDLRAAAPVKIAANPFRPVATTTTVCGPDGCKTVETTAAAGCPCKCPDCTCNTPASTPTTTTTTTVTSHAAGNCSAGPVRRVLGRVGKFVVRGGPIRQALRANRQARRGG
jgi:hypothetical protein